MHDAQSTERSRDPAEMLQEVAAVFEFTNLKDFLQVARSRLELSFDVP